MIANDKDNMTKFATPEGTTRYAKRFAGRAAEGHFREAHGLVMSSLGIGTYLGQPDPKVDASYTAAIAAAAEAGINVIDAAINYRFQRSERSIGAAIKQLAVRGFSREELIVCTKGGYLTPDGSMPEEPTEYFLREYIQPGVFTPKDLVAGSHCMTPRFLENQLARSLSNLQLDCIDVYYLHNPETQLTEVSRPDFLERVRDAFIFLESAADTGKIQFQVTFQAHRESGAPQRIARKAPLAADIHDGQDSFLDKFHDVPLIDRTHSAQILDAQGRGFVE